MSLGGVEQDFEREKLCYQQNCEQFRALNVQMNRIPTFAVTLTGGLWFGAALHEDYLDPNLVSTARALLLLLASLSNLALIAIAFRVRDVMRSYLVKIEEFRNSSFVTGKSKRSWLGGDYVMIKIYCTLMGVASVVSFAGAFYINSGLGIAYLLLDVLICLICFRTPTGNISSRQLR